MNEDEGTVDGDIGRDPRDRMLFAVFPNGENRMPSTQLPITK